MNYTDAANMLYKYAQEPIMPIQPVEPKEPNLVTGGAALGGMGGAWTGIKKDMKGSESKIKNLGASAKKLGFKGLSKQMITRGAIGAGLGMIGGAGLTALKNYGDSVKEASGNFPILEKYAGRPDYEQVKKELYETIANNVQAKDNSSSLKDIDCTVCNYRGKPDYKGQCPVCGAIGGYPPAEVEGGEKIEPAYTGEPRDGLSVAEESELERIQCYY